MKTNQYERFGIMLDCSRNGVMKIEKVKLLIDYMQKMGYNTLELYAEDIYEVQGEEYLGYMRGRYTGEELREIDAYAQAHGIELIPCIQTLAHFTAFVKNDSCYEMFDTADILLVGEERVYEFIDNIFSSLAKNFTSRQVNIGMDEAHMVGLGRYLDKNGYRNRFDILLEHLEKVSKIAKKYGFKAHMWSDMFFRLVNGGAYCSKEIINVPENVKKALPDGIDLVYWDYYQTEKSGYDIMFESHKGFNGQTWFAGAAWCAYGFAPYHTCTLKTMKPAMQSVIEHGVKNVLLTIWGDNGRDCSPFSLLPAMYAVRRYGDGVFDDKQIEREFNELFGLSYADLALLEIPNQFSINEFNRDKMTWNPCKCLLYQDVFMGLIDSEIEKYPLIPYGDYAKILEEKIATAGQFGYLFKSMSALCSVLEIKYTIGLKTRKLYNQQDKLGLSNLIKEYDEVLLRLEKFHTAFYELWIEDNNPQGFEIHDLRIGGLMRRIKTCKLRLQDYIDGKIATIRELDEDLLPYMHGLANHNYALTVSRSVL